MATKAHLEGNKRYLDKLDRGVFYVPKAKGGLPKVVDHIEKTYGMEMSLNAYINMLIERDMENESREK